MGPAAPAGSVGQPGQPAPCRAQVPPALSEGFTHLDPFGFQKIASPVVRLVCPNDYIHPPPGFTALDKEDKFAQSSLSCSLLASSQLLLAILPEPQHAATNRPPLLPHTALPHAELLCSPHLPPLSSVLHFCHEDGEEGIQSLQGSGPKSLRHLHRGTKPPWGSPTGLVLVPASQRSPSQLPGLLQAVACVGGCPQPALWMGPHGCGTPLITWVREGQSLAWLFPCLSLPMPIPWLHVSPYVRSPSL